MRHWLRETLSRRGLLGAGLAAAGGSVMGGMAARGQTTHTGHQRPRRRPGRRRTTAPMAA